MDEKFPKLSSLSHHQTLSLLKQLGANPQKQLGQNFLIDKNIVKKSIQLAQLQPCDNVVEPGPGLGTLTRELLNHGAHVFAVEFDPLLFRFLNEEFKNIPQFEILLGDATKFPLGSFKNFSENFKVIANLPYNISTPWFDAILSQEYLPSSITVMLQKETAYRLTSQHNSKHFSAISIFLLSAYQPEEIFPVSRSCFHPAPRVDSVILHLKKLTNPITFDPKSKKIIRQIFSHRRKQMGSLLRTFCPEFQYNIAKLLQQNNFSLSSRPEQIPITLWQQFNTVVSSSTSQENTGHC